MPRPLIRIFGGVHDDPWSHRRFLESLSTIQEPPQFVAVEWDESVFKAHDHQRSVVADGLEGRWCFLTQDDRLRLSAALAWEGDAFKQRFPEVRRVWLDANSGFETDASARAIRLLDWPMLGRELQVLDFSQWAGVLDTELAGLDGGWIAVVVGWRHANLQNQGRLASLLRTRTGLDIESICLAT